MSGLLLMAAGCGGKLPEPDLFDALLDDGDEALEAAAIGEEDIGGDITTDHNGP